MAWQDDVRIIRDKALDILRDYGEWVAPPTYGPAPSRFRKADVGEFHLVHRVPNDVAAPKPELRPYGLQIWFRGRQVAHLEWEDPAGPLDSRSFARGEWREEFGASAR